jgi:hypothetical protein
VDSGRVDRVESGPSRYPQCFYYLLVSRGYTALRKFLRPNRRHSPFRPYRPCLALPRVSPIATTRLRGLNRANDSGKLDQSPRRTVRHEREVIVLAEVKSAVIANRGDELASVIADARKPVSESFD